jgi:hypothetical protein
MLRRCQSKAGFAVLMAAAVVLVAAYGATAAQAAEGPNWIHGAAPGKVLAAGEKLTIVSESQGEVTLLSFANILCKSLQDKGELFGGKPGTDLEELEFLECRLEGKTVTECAATSAEMEKGVILTNVLTALGYPLNGQAGNEALDLVFPDGSNELFVTFILEGTKCGPIIANKTEVTVLAVGAPLIKEVKKELFEANCGESGLLGILNSKEEFETVGSGVLEEDGVVNFPGPESAELFTTAFVAITCKLEVDSGLIKEKGSEDAIVLVEALNAMGVKEPLGWEH